MYIWWQSVKKEIYLYVYIYVDIEWLYRYRYVDYTDVDIDRYRYIDIFVSLLSHQPRNLISFNKISKKRPFPQMCSVRTPVMKTNLDANLTAMHIGQPEMKKLVLRRLTLSFTHFILSLEYTVYSNKPKTLSPECFTGIPSWTTHIGQLLLFMQVDSLVCVFRGSN